MERLQRKVGRIACPACGGTETLNDLSRQAHDLRRRLGSGGPSALALEPPRQDACLSCGTLYDPWVHREASRRLVEIERLREQLGRGA